MELSCLFIVMFSVCVHAQPCLQGQQLFGSSCYQLLNGSMGWDEGVQACADMGGEMAVPDSPVEREFLWDMTSKVNSVWIGCDDKETEGVYVQSSKGGKECSYLAWADGQPWTQTADLQDCVLLFSDQDGLMADSSCRTHGLVICQLEVNIRCLLESIGDHFKANCMTTYFIKGLKAKAKLPLNSMANVGQRIRSIHLRQGSGGEVICQLGSNAEQPDPCHYFYI